MKFIMLVDEHDKPWGEFVVHYEIGAEFSERYYRNGAENKIVRKFMDYWLGGRFKNFTDEMVSEFKRMLIGNGWKFQQYEVQA